MQRREFFTKGFAALAVVAVPTILLSEETLPHETGILYDKDVHEMLKAGKPIIDQDIYLRNKLYLGNYDYIIIRRCRIESEGAMYIDIGGARGEISDCYIINNRYRSIIDGFSYEKI